MTGKELKIERIRSDVKACELARECGVSKVRISQVERMEELSAEWEKRYRMGILRILVRRKQG